MARARPGPTAGRLVIVAPGQTGLQAGEALALQPLTRLGRSGSNTIVLDDSFVSSEHAVISYRDGGWWLADHQSTNGTIVNDLPVDGPVKLEPGDVISLGQIRLKFAA